MGLLGWWPLSLCFPKQAPAPSRPPPGAPGDEKRHSAAVAVAADVPPAAPSPITRQRPELASHPLPDLPGSHLPTPDSSFTSVAAAPLDAAGAGAGAAAAAQGKAELVPGIGWSAMSAPTRPLLDSANQADGAAGFRAVHVLPRTPDAGVPRAVQQGHSAPGDRAATGRSPGQDVPLPVHTTPFASRVERALEAQQSACDARQQRAPATPQAGAAGDAAEAATRASRPLSASNTDRRRAAEDADPGKENGHASTPETVTPAPKPTIHPHSRAVYFFRTPSSETPSPHFIFDTLRRSSLGATPCVIGVANSAARYREDRSVRIHDTPFEQRVEREVAKEQAARARAARRSMDTRMPTL